MWTAMSVERLWETCTVCRCLARSDVAHKAAAAKATGMARIEAGVHAEPEAAKKADDATIPSPLVTISLRPPSVSVVPCTTYYPGAVWRRSVRHVEMVWRHGESRLTGGGSWSQARGARVGAVVVSATPAMITPMPTSAQVSSVSPRTSQPRNAATTGFTNA